LYAALGEVGKECRRLKLPPLPALVVRADTMRPGAAYYGGGSPIRGEQISAWRRDLEAVKRVRYPRCARHSHTWSDSEKPAQFGLFMLHLSGFVPRLAHDWIVGGFNVDTGVVVNDPYAAVVVLCLGPFNGVCDLFKHV